MWVKGEEIGEAGVPESFKVLVKELRSLGLSIDVINEDEQTVDISEGHAGTRQLSEQDVHEKEDKRWP